MDCRTIDVHRDALFGFRLMMMQSQAPHALLSVHTAGLLATATGQAAKASSCLHQGVPDRCCCIGKGKSCKPHAELFSPIAKQPNDFGSDTFGPIQDWRPAAAKGCIT